VLAHLLSYPDAELRAHLPELRAALHDERALTFGRLAELDALIDRLRSLRRRWRSRPSMSSCSTAAAAPRCTCSSMCTATAATAARRWSTCQDLRSGRPVPGAG
jgi:hypothetical protein